MTANTSPIVIAPAILAAFMLMSGPAPSAAGPAATALAPVDPESLLTALPAAPEGWQLEQSSARTSLADPGYEVAAIRRYRRIVDDNDPAHDPDGEPPAVFEIRLRDLARTGPPPFVFARLLDARADDDQPAAATWHSHPKILTEPRQPAGTGAAAADAAEPAPDFRLWVLIGGRFLLEAEGWRIAWNDARPWLDQTDHRRLARVDPVPLPATNDRRARLRRVDQIDPANNRDYEAVRGDPAAIEADNRAAGHIPGVTDCGPD